MSSLEDRVRGCVAGQFAGDSIGALVEFKSSGEIRKEYPHGVQHLSWGGPWDIHIGQITDDTEMAIAAFDYAHKLKNITDFSQDGIKDAYQAWASSNPFDIGHTIGAAMYRDTVTTDSESNGSLMRISFLAAMCANTDDRTIGEIVDIDATTTHANVTTRRLTQLYAIGIAYAINNPNKTGRDVFEHMRSANTDSSIDVMWARCLTRWNRLKDYKSSGHANNAFGITLFHLWNETPTMDAITTTISLGGDTDTNAAIVGAMLGAVNGITSFPIGILNGLSSSRSDNIELAARPEVYWSRRWEEIADAIIKDLQAEKDVLK